MVGVYAISWQVAALLSKNSQKMAQIAFFYQKEIVQSW